MKYLESGNVRIITVPKKIELFFKIRSRRFVLEQPWMEERRNACEVMAGKLIMTNLLDLGIDGV